jgi:hypothetical protein
MARAFSDPAALQIRPDDFYVVYGKVVTTDVGSVDSDYVALGQVESLDYSDQYDDKAYDRVGLGTARVAGSRKVDVTFRLYVDANLENVARVLGIKKPASWASEVIRLSPNRVIDFVIDGYSSSASGATVVHNIYIDDFSGRSVKGGLKSNDAVMLEVTGVATDVWSDPNPAA